MEAKFKIQIAALEDVSVYKKGDEIELVNPIFDRGIGIAFYEIGLKWRIVWKRQFTGLKDKNGLEIYVGEKFKFEYLKNLHENPLKLIGIFDWNQNELRYEIDILDNEDYVCLSYVGNGVMRNFELF